MLRESLLLSPIAAASTKLSLSSPAVRTVPTMMSSLLPAPGSAIESAHIISDATVVSSELPPPLFSPLPRLHAAPSLLHADDLFVSPVRGVAPSVTASAYTLLDGQDHRGLAHPFPSPHAPNSPPDPDDVDAGGALIVNELFAECKDQQSAYEQEQERKPELEPEQEPEPDATDSEGDSDADVGVEALPALKGWSPVMANEVDLLPSAGSATQRLRARAFALAPMVQAASSLGPASVVVRADDILPRTTISPVVLSPTLASRLAVHVSSDTLTPAAKKSAVAAAPTAHTPATPVSIPRLSDPPHSGPRSGTVSASEARVRLDAMRRALRAGTPSTFNADWYELKRHGLLQGRHHPSINAVTPARSETSLAAQSHPLRQHVASVSPHSMSGSPAEAVPTSKAFTPTGTNAFAAAHIADREDDVRSRHIYVRSSATDLFPSGARAHAADLELH